MNFKQYQEKSRRTMHPKATDMLRSCILLSNYCMGLSGEAGEVVDYMKKVLHHGHEFDKGKLKKELGDVLWYLSAICSETNINLEDVAMGNVEKLKSRYPNGFDRNDSVNRVD